MHIYNRNIGVEAHNAGGVQFDIHSFSSISKTTSLINILIFKYLTLSCHVVILDLAIVTIESMDLTVASAAMIRCRITPLPHMIYKIFAYVFDF